MDLRLRTRFPRLAWSAATAGVCLESGLPVRIGEGAVASFCVHLLDPVEPGTVRVLRDSDAGRVLYGRQDRGAILHLDVFHQVGDLDHLRVAEALCLALDAYGAEFHPASPEIPSGWAEFIDLQTGTGGGRLNGQLVGGQKPSLRRAHRNHVHITLALPAGAYALLFYLVAAVEQAVVAGGLEPRRVDGVRVVPGEISADNRALEAYRDQMDTRLAGEGAHQDEGAHQGDGDEIPPERQRRFGQAVELAEKMEGSRAAGELLDRLAATGGRVESAAVLSWLTAQGLARGNGLGHQLTEEGHRLRRTLAHQAREVELALQKQARARARKIAAHLPPGARRDWTEARRGWRRRLVERRSGTPLAHLALGETVAAAAARRISSSTAAAPANLSAAAAPVILTAADLRLWEQSRPRACDLCLLIDASASMAGERITAAKELARHLLLQTRDRVAVITFQERQVDVRVPFTRHYALVQEGLRRIRPAGLTPLALGLREGARLIQGNGGRRTLVVLITDGIPTVSTDSPDPLADALNEAIRLATQRVRLTCIGLQPNAGFLRRLVTLAGGTLHVVEDLERDTLLRITFAERQKA